MGVYIDEVIYSLYITSLYVNATNENGKNKEKDK